MDTFKLYLAGKIVNVNEGKMKDLAMKIDRVASNMRKDRMMKPFVDKFKKDAMKTLDVRKSLEKIIPKTSQVTYGQINYALTKENLDEVAMGRVKNKPLAPIPALTKANIKHSHNQSAFKKNKTMVGVSDKDYDKAKKIVGNMPNVMLHTEAVNEMHCKDCGCEKGNIRPDCDCPNNGSAPATAEHWVSGTNEAMNFNRMKLINKIAKKGSPKVKSALKAPSRVDNKDKNKNEGLWDNIRKKKARIARGSGEKMRKVGDKGAPTPDQIKRAKGNNEEVLDEKIAGLVTKAEKSGMPYGILKKVYDRGMAAYKTGHRPGTTAQQWAFARVNSFVTKSSGTWGKADADLAAKVRGSSKKEVYEIGKDYGDHTRKITPGQSATKESVKEWYLDENTRDKYEERFGDNWLVKLTETYNKMLSKLPCCDDCDGLYEHTIVESEYQGKKVKLNDPIRTSENPNKKFKVYVKNEKGKVVVVRFGDPNMSINRDDPKARKSFRARHGCDTDPGPKWKAKYWSCYQWRGGAKVDN